MSNFNAMAIIVETKEPLTNIYIDTYIKCHLKLLEHNERYLHKTAAEVLDRAQ